MTLMDIFQKMSNHVEGRYTMDNINIIKLYPSKKKWK